MPNRILYGVLAFLILSYALSFVPHPLQKRAVRSAFMSGTDAASLDVIEIEGADGKTALYKKNEIWYGESGGAVFPAENAKVLELIQHFINVRKLYTILDSNTAIPDKNQAFI